MFNLPSFVKESYILSDIEKERLSSILILPTEIEVDSIRVLPEIQELQNAFIGDESTLLVHLQLKAKEYLNKGDIVMAWKILLL